MNQSLKRISCDPTCGFMVQSHDEKEVVDIATKHVHQAHPDMKVSRDDVKSRMKMVKG
jgi:predicted small metal-binding protein